VWQKPGILLSRGGVCHLMPTHGYGPDQRSKHINIKYHFVRSIISNGKMALHYIPTENNITGTFTKPFGPL